MAEKNLAQEALKKVESRLECGICLGTYTNPRVLPCFHVFCTDCLKKSIEKSRDKNNLTCPNCRRSIPLPPKGIEGLQTAFHIDHLFEIRDTLVKAKETEKTKCQKCEESIATGYCRDCSQFVCDNCTKIHKMWKKELSDHKITTMAEIQREAANLVPPKKKAINCPKHPEEKLKIFCETCQELACFYCTIRYHQSHQHDTVSDVFPKHKEAIEGELKPVKEHLKKLTQAARAFEKRETEITEKRMEVEAEIHKRIDRLCQLLQQRKTELLTQLDQVTQQKMKRLVTQREELELRQAQVQNCIDYVEGSLKTGSQEEILALKASTLKQLQVLTTDLKADTVEPQESAILRLVMDNLEHTCKGLGVVEEGELRPDECQVTGEGLEFAVVGEKANSTLKVVNNKGKAITIPRNVTAELVTVSDQSSVKCNVSGAKESTCSIDYVPQKCGEHQLHVKIAGKHVHNSPFTVTVMPALTCFEQPIATFPDLERPWGVAITSKRQLVVAETKGNHVSILTLEGKKIRSFGTRGSANGQLKYPGGVAIDNEDNIYIADAWNHRIQKFGEDGHFIAAVGGQGSNQLQFNTPYGITFNKKDGKLYVCDTGNSRLQVLTTGLQYSGSIGSQGSGNGQLNCPEDVAFDSQGQMYVADGGNNRIQVFSAEGQYCHMLGTNILQSPYGVNVDMTGRVYAVEQYAHRISIFTSGGECIRSFNIPGGGHPLRVAIDTKTTHFFVSLYGANKILKF